MQDYRKLKVWREAHELVMELYALTKRLYGLTSQLRRSATSIPFNLAEGCGVGSDAAFGRHVQIAQGSGSELDYQLLLARDLGYVSAEVHARVVDRLVPIRRMLNALQRRLSPANSQ